MGSNFVGAAKVMSEAEKQQLAQIVTLAKAGNPRAIKALATLKQSGEIMGGSSIGWGITDALKFSLMPITAPAQGLWAAAKWAGRKIRGGGGAPPTPEQVRLDKMRAARARAVAAQAKARAADAETEAELRAQQTIQQAAQAEAEAADAEALSKEAAMRTKEIEANPDSANPDEGDSSGAFIGSWTKYVGYDATVKDPFETSAQKVATEKAIREKQLVSKAAEKSATGTKIRAGAELYQRATVSHDPKAMAAIDTMVAKAKKGDPQARRDVLAVKAGAKALKAKDKAIAKEIAALNSKARKLKVIAAQRKVEAGIANKLAVTERRVLLTKYAHVEAKAAKGDKKAQAYIAKNVAAAKKGDKKAQNRVGAMQLGKKVRLATPTKSERRALAQAGSLHKRVLKNDPKAIRQLTVIKDAAKQGNPNAKRAVKRYDLAAVVITAGTTGVLTGVAATKSTQKPYAFEDRSAATLASAQKKLAANAGTREEYAAGAKAAANLGDKDTAGKLSIAAANAPSATEQLQKAQSVVAAKNAGNEEAKTAISKSFEEAKSGDPAAIARTGKVVAVQTIDDINQGKPVPPAMTDAINLHERIAAGDPAATEQAKLIMSEATKPNPIPEATAAAVTLAAAGITASAMASKPNARAEFLAKVNPPLEGAEKGTAEERVNELVAKAQAGTITAQEGDEGIRLASRLGKPTIAAKISSMSPPMERDNPLSSLPDMPLPPITGVWDLVKETLKAVTLATRDPLGNYREGVRTRAMVRQEPVTTSGWSPFPYFRAMVPALKVAMPWIAPVAASAAAAASFANLAMSKQNQKPATPAPAPAPTPVTSAPAEPVVPPVTKNTEPVSQPKAPSETKPAAKPAEAATSEETTSEGSLSDAGPAGQTALLDRAMTSRELGRLVDLIQKINAKSLSPEEQSEGLRLAIKLGLPIAQEKFINYKGQEASPKKQPPTSQSGESDKKTFKSYITTAIKDKKMSKADFNAAMEIHLGDKTTPEKKIASGEKILKFLAGKGVKIES